MKHSIKIEVFEEFGYRFAMLGLSLNFDQPVEKMPEIAKRLAGKGNGHDKFLRVMFVNLDIRARRHWWQEFDAYKCPNDGEDGLVPTGAVSQSQSTMHTITKRLLDAADFASGTLQAAIDLVNSLIPTKNKMLIKDNLPEGFLQRRCITINYASLLNMLRQRKTHQHPDWRYFCEFIMDNVQHPELLPDIPLEK